MSARFTAAQRGLCALTSAAWLAACAANLGPSYLEARDRALKAYSEGDYPAAARHWHQAAQFADVPRHRDAARYRQAMSASRAGDLAQAIVLLQALSQSPADPVLAARSLYDLGRIAARRGQDRQATEYWQAVFRNYPGAPIAPAAWRQWLLAARSHVASDAEWSRVLAVYVHELRPTPLAELAHFSYARALQDAGQRERALLTYLKQASQYPFPEGLYWDEALWQAAQLQRSMNQPELALETLAELLQAGTARPDWLGGVRPLVARARFQRALILRDDLHRHPQAIDEFHRVWQEHETSPLSDDGLWEAALLARQTGRTGLACQMARQLSTARPRSRFTACASLLCSGETSPTRGACKPHLRARMACLRGPHHDSCGPAGG